MNSLEQYLNPLKERWIQLSSREQILSIISGIMIAIWLIWQLIINPLASRQSMAQQRLQASQHQLMQIQQQGDRILQLKASGSTLAAQINTPMDQVINQSAPAFDLNIERVKNRQNGLEIAMSPARFDQLMSWLVKLEKDSKIKVTEFQLDATGTSGTVDVKRLQLERG